MTSARLLTKCRELRAVLYFRESSLIVYIIVRWKQSVLAKIDYTQNLRNWTLNVEKRAGNKSLPA